MNPENVNIPENAANTAKTVKELVGSVNVEICKGKSEYKGADICVVPNTADDISKIIAIANKNKVRIVSSNNPAWALDGTKTSGGMFIDLRKMNGIIDIDKTAMTVRVCAGCTYKTLSEACSKEGLILGSGPFDRSTTVGSWVAANGIGYGTYKYGNSKDNVTNLKIVVEDGSVIETGYDRIGYYMSGYNLNQLFAGSEGTLGVIVEATLKLIPKDANRMIAFEFPSINDMQSAITKIVQHPSVNPRNIAWCGKNRTINIVLNGARASVDLEEEVLNRMMEESAGTKVGKDIGCKVCESICGPKSKDLPKAIVPVKNWAGIVSDCNEQVYGVIADRRTAYLIAPDETDDKLSEKAVKAGGRALGCNAFIWTPSMLKEEDTKDLDREVTPEIISKLGEIVGVSNVTTNGVDLILYSKDMAPLPKEAGIVFKNLPDVVVRPSTVKEISEIVKLAYKHGIPVIPRGNSSWGLGGCMPINAGIVVDLSSKMNKIYEINTDELYVKVGMGCTWKEVLDACMKKGYIVGSYPSSFPAATIGAWLATNGMGVGSYKYGSAKDNILNMEVVLSNGKILETGNDHVGPYKNGYNMNQVFSGSEGTLAIFGTATLRIQPMGVIRPTAYCYENLRDMNDTIQKIVNHPSIIPMHIAFSDHMHFESQRKAGITAPDVKNLLLLTFQGDPEFVERDIQEMDGIASELGGKRIDDAIAEHEWEERCYEFRARNIGVGEIPAEVVIPTHEWGAFTEECYQAFDTMKMEAGGIIGVVVDRNTSMFMPYYFKDDESILGMTAFAFNFFLGDRATLYGGRTTGFGVFFAWNLDNIHDAATVSYIRNMKTMLDPRDVVNPGHLVCGSTRFGINMNNQLMTIGSSLIQAVKKLLPKNKTFAENKKRFRYNRVEHRKEEDRTHTLGDGTQ